MKRIIIKISGESLKNKNQEYNIDEQFLKRICLDIKKLYDRNMEIAIVVGGGNIWRGRNEFPFDSVISDRMGMLGTVINALALAEELKVLGIDAIPMSNLNVDLIIRKYEPIEARKLLNEHKIIIVGGGLGITGITTDTAAIHIADELNVDALLFGKTIAGIYDKNPKKYPDAKLYKKINHIDLLQIHINNGVKTLGALDFVAEAMACLSTKEIIVFDMNDLNFFNNLINSQDFNGTIISTNNDFNN
jgi:uridylate kinase